MNITKEQVTNILYILDNEYQGILVGDATRDKLKIDTWHAKLRNYSYEECQSAVSRLLDSKVYGKPNISDLMEKLKPTLEQQNIGAEFSQRVIDLASRYGTYNISKKVKDEYGEVGYSVYMQIRDELRELLTEDIPTFRAQVRNVFNSYYERYQYDNTITLPYSREKESMQSISTTIENIQKSMPIDEDKIKRLEITDDIEDIF